MKSLKGLCTDTRPLDTPEGYYVFGKNGIQGNIDGSVTNEKGFIKLNIPDLKYKINGVIETDSVTVIFSTDNTYSEIGVLDTAKEIYTTIVDDSLLDYKLNFNQDNPIKGEFQRNYKKELICAWKDNLNPPRIINIDNNKNVYVEDYLLFSSWKKCTINSSVSQGGSLLKGCYVPVIRYINEGLYTDYFVYGRPCYTGNGNNSEITLTITNLDKRYKQIQVAFLSTISGVTKVIELTPVSISDIVSVNYNGSYESETSLDILFAVTPYYTNVKAITQLNDELFLANLEEFNMNKINYYMQKQALTAKLKWKSTLVSNIVQQEGSSSTSFTSNDNYLSGKYKGFAHQEVYSFFIIGNLANGRKTGAYLIANRESIPDDIIASIVGSRVGVTAKKYQLEDTINFSSLDFVNNTGEFGYWENEDEYYPEQNIEGFGNPFEDFVGKRVRHFKTPSHQLCYQNFYSDSSLNYGSKDLDVLSVIVDDFVIPSEIADYIVSYELVYAKRTQVNITNIGQSLLLVGSKQRTQTGEPFNVTSTGGNFNYKAYGTDLEDDKANFMEESILRFHSFDMLFNKLAIKPDIILNQLKYKKTLNTQTVVLPINNVTDIFNNTEGLQNDKGDFDTVFYKERSIYQIIDYTNTSKTSLNISVPVNNNLARKITNFKFAPNNSYFGDIDNRLLESCYTATLSGDNSTKLIEDEILKQTITGTENEIYFPAYEITYLSNLIRIVTNVFVNFYNQELVNTGVAITDSTSQPIYGGDMFISDYSFVTYGKRDIYDTVNSAEGSNRFVHRFLCETASNVNLRYEKTGDIYTNFYPKSNGKWIRSLDKSLEPNSFGYDKELNLLLEENITSFNPFAEPQYIHPFRITRTSPNQREKSKRNWRNFAPLDYYEQPKNYGEIINLDSLDDKLLIHHKNALFVTREKARLSTDILNVVLGAGDIFEFNPIQALETNLGYGGTKQDVGLIVSPLGYHFIEDGKPFIYKNGLKSLTNSLYNFFSSFLYIEENNPFKNKGITYGYDRQNKRFLLTVKNEDKSYTLSYSIEKDNWTFFHSYIPDFYFHTKNDLFSIKDNKIYKNFGGRAGVYYTEEINPFIIDIVFRTEDDVTLGTINWVSENVVNYLAENEYIDEFNTITHISVRNSHQHTSRIDLRNKTWWDKNYSKKRNQFSFNEIRNAITRGTVSFIEDVFKDYKLKDVELIDNWYNKDYLESNFFVVRFEYDNNINSMFCLNEVGITYIDTL